MNEWDRSTGTTSEMIDHARLLAQVAEVPPGRVRTFFAPDVVDTLALLASAATRDAAAPLLSISWPEGAGIQQAIRHMVHSLAGVALAQWPDWYGERHPFGHSGIGEPLSAEHDPRTINRLGERYPALDRAWVKRAVRRCRRGELPVSRDFPQTANLRQLALAIGQGDLIVLLALENANAHPAELLCFARAAAWVAGESSARVAAFVPAVFWSAGELDAISYDGRCVGQAGLESSTFTRSPKATASRNVPQALPGNLHRRAKDEPLRLVLPPITGRPHPASPGEQRLAAWLARDPELSPLFEFNQRVDCSSGESFVVDLLWRAGKITVEVDGYTWHSGPHAFSANRHRDYRLLCDGYRTLRLPHDEVMDDPALQCEKIRDVVRAIQKEK